MEQLEPVWTVYFHNSNWLTPGRNTLMGEVFELLKLDNIFNHDGYQKIDPETVVAAEPDIIIADSLESIVDNPALSGLHMAQDPEHIPHHIFVLDGELSFDPDDHNFMDAVEELAAFVYPDVFVQGQETEHSHEDDGDGEDQQHSHDESNNHSH